MIGGSTGQEVLHLQTTDSLSLATARRTPCVIIAEGHRDAIQPRVPSEQLLK